MKIRDSPVWDENDFRGHYRRVLVDEHLEWAQSYAFEQPTNIGLVQVACNQHRPSWHHPYAKTRKPRYSLLPLLNIILAPVPTLFRHYHQNYGESYSRSQSDHARTYPRRSMHQIQVVLLTHSHSLWLPLARLYYAQK